MKPEHILVVDDEKRIVESITRCLTREGFRVFYAYDGLQAVTLFNSEKIDLVLMDISMPDMDGYEAMAKMLELDPEILVIIMTGYASVSSAVTALKQGAWDYLKKPFEFADLVKTVKNAVAQRNLIAEKRFYEARLEASEKQYQYMVDNSPDLIFTLDENFRFAFANQQFEILLGYSPQELKGTAIDDILHEDDRSKLARQFCPDGLLFRDIATGCSAALNLRFKNAGSGENRYDPYSGFAFMEMKASVLTLPDIGSFRDFKGIYAVARDVTDRIRLENQLRQAQKMEAIGTLAGGIAHDFNNILMGIQGYSSLVKSGFSCDSEEYKRLANIDEYIYNGAEMARQLLDFSRKNSRQAEATLNMNYLLRTSVRMFGRTRKDIFLSLELEKDLWPVTVDETQIKQVLMNLFVNAWHAMPKGGRIVVKSENVVLGQLQASKLGLDPAGEYVKICVADTGTGMGKETLSRVFDPFFTTKARGRGTGLGLSTAYGIVNAHKGTFQVESSPGKGSVFMFFLPAEKEEQEQPDADRHLKEGEGRLVSGKGRVLLVDDEKGVIEVCKEMIETLGYEVLVAGTGAQAVSVVQDDVKGIDLMILDVVMPGMDGFQTYEAVRRLNPDLRVLVCSGLSPKEEIKKMIAGGCRDFLLKPFDIARLSQKIESVLCA